MFRRWRRPVEARFRKYGCGAEVFDERDGGATFRFVWCATHAVRAPSSQEELVARLSPENMDRFEAWLAGFRGKHGWDRADEMLGWS